MSDAPLYLIGAVLDQGDTGQTFLNLSESFDSDTSIAPKRGRELQGWVYPMVHEGAVYVPDPKSPTLSRYTVDSEGALKVDEEISFAGLGVSGGIGGDRFYFVGSKKAYFFDWAGLRAIVFNPQRMELTGEEIDLEEVAREGYNASIRSDVHQAVRRGNDLFFPLVWNDQDWNSRFSQGLLVLDAKTDEVTAILDDDRCGDSFVTIKTASDDIYVFPSAGAALQFHVNAETPRASCALRVKAGEYAFDPDYRLDLSSLVDDVAAQGAFPDADGTGFFFGAYDKKRHEEGDTFLFWRLYHYDLDSEEVQPVDVEEPYWSGAMRYYTGIDGGIIAPRWDWGETIESTTIWRIADGAEVETLFSIPAAVTTLARIR